MPRFLNPSEIIAQTGLMQGQVVADLGCGHGFYVIPAAQMVGSTGTVYAVDMLSDKLAATISIANQFGYRNVRVVQADLTQPIQGIAPHSCDLVIVGNILHQISKKESLVSNIYKILKSPGHVIAIEWKRAATPFGPPLDNRLDQQQLETILQGAGFRKEKNIQADDYHYAVMYEK